MSVSVLVPVTRLADCVVAVVVVAVLVVVRVADVRRRPQARGPPAARADELLVVGGHPDAAALGVAVAALVVEAHLVRRDEPRQHLVGAVHQRHHLAGRPLVGARLALDLVAEGIRLRKRIAALLGYESWAALATETRMSGSPANIDAFVGPLAARVAAGARADLDALRDLKRSDAGDATCELEASDVSFYSALRLKNDYGVDHEAVKRYFPLDHVVETTMRIYQELLGLVFTEIFAFDTWHPSVRLFKVEDAATSEKMGFFYLDLFPRDGKYGHAAIFHLLKRWKTQVPVDCMLCNLPEPADGKPALLRHSNCVTFFHEFGHIMHGLCAVGDGNATTLAKCHSSRSTHYYLAWYRAISRTSCTRLDRLASPRA